MTKVAILDQTRLAQGRFKLSVTRVRIAAPGRAPREITHEVYSYGPAAAILLYDSERGVVLLVRQFRLGAYLADGSTDVLEVCAGMLDGDDPATCALREAREETGVEIAAAQFAFNAFMSPGGTSETIACFVAPYRLADRRGAGGGVDADEDIEIVELGFAQALAMIEAGAIRDAKTIALIYYANAKGLLRVA